MARFLKNKQLASGSAPGSLIFIGKQKIERPRLLVTRYTPDRIEEEYLRSPALLPSSISGDHRTWIALQGLHDTDLVGDLGRRLSIDPLALEDILNTDERPKYTEDARHLHLILKSLRFDRTTGKVDIEQISFVLGRDYLLTFQETDSECFDDVRRRLNRSQGKIREYTPDYLCYALIDSLVDNYILTIEKLGNVIEEQEKTLLSAGSELIENTYRYKTELAYLRKHVRPVKEAVTRLLSSDSDLIAPATRKYLRDLDSLVVQAIEAIEVYYTMLSDQQNSYHANISKNANDVMKVLTIFSAIFIPLTFLVGVYGMNFKHIPALDYPYAYYILWGIMATIALLMLLLFKKKKWL